MFILQCICKRYMPKSQMKTIVVTPEVQRAIGECGHAGESYNTVLARLLGVKDQEQEPKVKRKKAEGAQCEQPQRLQTRNKVEST